MNDLLEDKKSLSVGTLILPKLYIFRVVNILVFTVDFWDFSWFLELICVNLSDAG